MKFDTKGFSDAVKARRGKNGLRKAQSECGVSPATLLRIERGKDLTIDTFVKTCEWLDIHPGQFFKVEK